MDVILQVLSETEQAGLNDRFVLVKDNQIVFACPGSRGPNHRTPRRFGSLHWNTRYGRLALGTYDYECVQHRKYGKSLLINKGGACKSDVINPNHNDYLLYEVFIHSASSGSWRGSAGCPVTHPAFYSCFMWFFRIGGKGKLHVINHTGCACESYS